MLSKYLFSCLIFLFSGIIPVRAAHLIGGQLSYECLGGDEYRFTMTLYRDCQGGGAAFDSAPGAPIAGTVTVYRGDNTTPTDIIILDAPIVSAIVTNPSCGSPSLCVEEGRYTFTLNLANTGEPVHVTYQRCCRAITISNLVDPEATGMTMMVTLTSGAMNQCNTSPVFLNGPMICSLAGSPFTYNHAGFDADGDSLVYTFCGPLAGGGENTLNPEAADGVAPNPDLPPPYAEAVFLPNYSPDVPISGDPTFSIDAGSGAVTGTPDVLGRFAYAVCVQEFRAGALLSEVRLEFTHQVTNGGTTDVPQGSGMNDRLQLYPNPASDVVIVELPNQPDDFSVSLTSINGGTIKRWKAEKKERLEINSSKLDAGVYFIQAICGDRIFREKLIIR